MKKIALAALALLCSTPAFAQAVSVPAATKNGSVVITTGNTFQTVLAAGSRRSLTIQNNNATDNCWITFGSIGATAITAGNAAKASSQMLAPGGAYTRYFPYVPNDAIQGTCASNSDTLYIDTN